jgi:hypothetical protein
MRAMNLLSYAACSADTELAKRLPFACTDIDHSAIPAALRRRSSQAMQLAFSAAGSACSLAGRSPSALPALFASVAGEIRTTDLLCRELVKADGVVSPSAFHNSVQNTVAGYWSIAHQCTQAASALAAGRDTAAMALLEAWCQLASNGGELLLVCYDEIWPEYLASGMGQSAVAYAMVFAAEPNPARLAELGRPQRVPQDYHASAAEFKHLPILDLAPLLGIVASAKPAQNLDVAVASGWTLALTI